MFTAGALASRVVNGQRRFFVMASSTDGNLVVEVVDTGSYNPTLGSAPVAKLAGGAAGGMWGSVTGGRTHVQGGDYGVPRGLLWANNRLYWTYGASYTGGNYHNPSIGMAVLDDSTGAVNTFGPWRTSQLSQLTSRQGLLKIPAAFAAAYTGGKQFATYSSMASGYGSSPYGPNLFAVNLPTESTPPDATDNQGARSIQQQTLLAYDQFNRLPVNAKYRRTNPVTSLHPGEKPYTVGGGLSNYLEPGFARSDAWAEELGQTLGEVWIDLPDKQGLVTFGTMVTTLPGYAAPNDPEGLVHFGYGDPSGGSGSGTYPGTSGARAPQRCYHGQDDPFWQATGPWAHAVVPWVFVHGVPSITSIAAGAMQPHAARTSSDAYLGNLGLSLTSHPSGRFRREWTGASPVVDEARRLVFVVVNQIDNTQGTFYAKAAIAVFEVR
jgi:hypothetical protein